MKTFLLYITLCITINAEIAYYSFPAVTDQLDSIKFTFNYIADSITVGCNYNPNINSTTNSDQIYLNLKSELIKPCENSQYVIGLSTITTVKEIQINVYSSKDGSFISQTNYTNSYFENTQVSLTNNQFFVAYNTSLDFIINDVADNQKIFVEILRCSTTGIYVKKYSTDTYFNYLSSIDGYGINHYDYLEKESDQKSIYQKYIVDDYYTHYDQNPIFLIKYQRYNSDKDFNVNDYTFPSYLSYDQNNRDLIISFQPVTSYHTFNYIEYIVKIARQEERPNLVCSEGTNPSNYNYYQNYTQQVVYDYSNSNRYDYKEVTFNEPNPSFDYATLTVIVHLNNGIKIQREISGTYFYFYNRHNDEILQMAMLPVWISIISLSTIFFSVLKYKLKMRKQNNQSVQVGAVPGF